jgi:hypothetical protein
MKKIYYFAFAYLILGLVFGVFYREFTVFHDYNGSTQLSVLHTHTLVLGGFFFLILLVLNQVFNLTTYKRFDLWFIIYNIGLLGLLSTMLIRGIGQVLSWNLSGFNHIAGLFHTILGIGLVWFMILLGKQMGVYRQEKS